MTKSREFPASIPGRRASRGAVLAAIALLAPIAVASPARAARLDLPVRELGARPPAPAYAGGRLIVRLQPGAARAAYAALGRVTDPAGLRLARTPALAAIGARLGGAWFEPEFRGLRADEWGSALASFWIAHLPAGATVAASLDALEGAPDVESTSPIAIMPLEDTAALGAPSGSTRERGARLDTAAPNDSMWNLCYWLQQPSRKDLHALEAWDVTRGDSSAVIAILDTGVLLDHPDLAGRVAGQRGNLWANRAELEGLPGVDDDGNGFVDDVVGWDFVALDSAAEVRPGEDWRDQDNDPNDFAVHGTAVAGVAAAIANNGIGIPGVAPGARIMALRAGYSSPLDPPGEMDLAAVAQAIVYAARNGATVINCSFATTAQPDLSAAADVALAAHVVIVMAAGNNGSQHFLALRDEVLSVAASDQNDQITMFSNLGAYVDVTAPGQSIATLTLRATGTDSVGLRTPSYSGGEAGTSFSSPMVAGAVALLQTQRNRQGLPPLSPYLVVARVAETADDISALNPDGGYGSGRLNLLRLLTDPPTTHGFPTTARTIGSSVVVRTESGRAWIAQVFSDGTLRVFDADDGSTVSQTSLGGLPAGGVAAADFGAPVGIALVVALEDGRIAAYDLHARPLAGWPVDATGTLAVDDMMPALGDLDGDGRPEVVWGGDDGAVWAWHTDGTRVAGFPRRIAAAGRNVRIALGDLDGRPGLEIVAATGDFAVQVLSGSGVPLPGWPQPIGANPAAPVIDRLGTNPVPAVIVAAGFTVRAFDPDGTRRFLTQVPTVIVQDPALGDLDGDGYDEIVVVSSGFDVCSVLDSAGVIRDQRTAVPPASGAPLIGPLAPGIGAQILYPNLLTPTRTRLIALSGASGLPDLGNWPKPGHPAGAGVLLDANGDGATDVVAGAGDDSLNYVYFAGRGTWRPDAARWPTPRGNFARTGSRLDAPPLGVADDQPPPAITDLTAVDPTTHGVTLRWTAPTDAGASPDVVAYDMRSADAPITDLDFALADPVPHAPAPAAHGVEQQMTVDSLPEGRSRWFALRSRDAQGNWSPASNSIEVRTGSRAPALVGDLRVVSGSDSTLTLGWTASGDDGTVGRPSFYRVRWSEAPLDSAAFADAPLGTDVPARADAGHFEECVLRGLRHGHRYWIAMRAVDAAGNVSPLSNQVAPYVGRLAVRDGVAMLPSRSPARVPVEIEWQGAPQWSNGPQSIQIFDLHGRLLRQLGLPAEASGIAVWDGQDMRGTAMRSGVYFARLNSGPIRAQAKIVLLR